MFTVKEVCAKSSPKEEIESLFSLRYKIFYSRLNWSVDVNSKTKQEKDQYDRLHTKYLCVTHKDVGVVGCWRIIPTTYDYMLKNTFPSLLDNESAPCSSKVYELSRFAVDKNHKIKGLPPSKITKIMFKSIFQYAVEHDIEKFITVTSVSVEKIIKMANIPSSRIGNGNTHMLGKTKSVALSIPINKQFKNAVLNY